MAAKPPLAGIEPKLGANITICVVPRFPARPLVEQAILKRLVETTTLEWRQTIFPKIYNPMISQHESLVVLHPEAEFSLCEINVWGMLFYGTNLETETIPAATRGIHLYHVAGCVLVFLRHSDKILHALGYSGPLLVEASIESILGVPWIYAPRGFVETKSGSELDDQATFSIETTTDLLREKQDKIAMEVLQCIGFSADWPQLVDSPQKLEALIRAGYKYNFWTAPDSLRV